MTRPSWHARAACRGKLDIMYPALRQGGEDTYDRALAVCKTCPVKMPCREAGVREHFGVWGGTTPADRFPRTHGKSRKQTWWN